MRTVLYNCGPIVTFDSNEPLVGIEMSNDKWVLPAGNAIIIKNNVIEDIRDSREALDDYESHSTDSKETQIIDINAKAVIPGLIDSHSHLVWGGDRSREVRLKLQGKSYLQIAKMGGGINSTVAHTRQMSELELFNLAKQRAVTALKNGTTFIETKSGYGLNNESELKLLSVAKRLRLDDMTPGVDSTWLGAHAIPKGHDLESYTHEIINSQLPAIAQSGLARSADVFCEPGWFGVDESKLILKEAEKLGLDLRMHIDEFCDGGGGQLAAEMNVTTADHAHHTNEEAREQMNKSAVNTGFLPGTPYSMGSEWPNFNHMIEKEYRWTIATDYNPNNQILSLPFIGSCLVQRCGVDPLATLAACTINPSFTTPHNTGMQHGKIAPNAMANLNILNSNHWESWCLTPGHSPIAKTIIEGKFVINE